MELETIERILREGPPDEPAYVPGAFRRTSRPGAWLLSAAAIGLTLLVGVLAGIGLSTVRDQWIGTGAPEPLTTADLDGTWLSEPISSDALVDGLVAQGFARGDVVAALEPSAFDRIQYSLRFTDGTLTIFSRVDDGPLERNSAGAFTVANGDTLVYAENVEDAPGVGDICNSLTAHVELRSGSLVMADVQLPEEACGRAVRIIHAAFFTLSPFEPSGR